LFNGSSTVICCFWAGASPLTKQFCLPGVKSRST
jgi:hypothetical protein